MKLQLIDLAIASSGSIALGIALWQANVKPLVKKEIVTVTPVVTKEEVVEKHTTNEDLLAIHNNPARVAEYVKKCALRNRKVLPTDYIIYCINCGENIKVA